MRRSFHSIRRTGSVTGGSVGARRMGMAEFTRPVLHITRKKHNSLLVSRVFVSFLSH